MKKVLVSSFLACAVSVPGLAFTSAAQTAPPPSTGQTAPPPSGSQTAPPPTGGQASGEPAGPSGAPQWPPMADAEYKAYTDANSQTQPQAKAAAIESYLT